MRLHLFTLFAPAASAAGCPSKSDITAIFSHLTGDNPSVGQFFAHVAPSVHWTIEGTHPAAGTYTNRTVLEATFARIASTASTSHPFRFGLTNIVADGEWSVQELSVVGVCKNGMLTEFNSHANCRACV